MKRFVILLVVLLTLQGCSISLPMQETIQLPKNYSQPSILVNKSGYISVLEIDGKQTKLTKVSITAGFNSYRSKSKYYFLMQTFLSMDCSLWMYDFGNKTLSCLITQIKNAFRIQDISIMSDQSCFIYSVNPPSGNIFNTNYIFHIYSLKKNQEITIDVPQGDIITDIRETVLSNQYLIVTQKSDSNDSDKKEIVSWNIETNQKKNILSFEGNTYVISKDNKWLVLYENNALIRFSLVDGKKTTLKENISECDFEFVGTIPYLLVREFSLDSDKSLISYVSLDNLWTAVTFEMSDSVNFFHTIQGKVVMFSVENSKSGSKKLVYWDPDSNESKILFQSKSIDLVFDRVSDGGNFVEFKGNDPTTSKKCFVIVDLETKKARVIYSTLEIAYPVSYDDSIWLFQQDDTFTKTKVKELMIYNWKQEKEYPLKVNWSGNLFPIHASNNGEFIVFSAFGSSFWQLFRKQTFVMNIHTGKRIYIPKAGKFEVITWLN